MPVDDLELKLERALNLVASDDGSSVVRVVLEFHEGVGIDGSKAEFGASSSSVLELGNSTSRLLASAFDLLHLGVLRGEHGLRCRLGRRLVSYEGSVLLLLLRTVLHARLVRVLEADPSFKDSAVSVAVSNLRVALELVTAIALLSGVDEAVSANGGAEVSLVLALVVRRGRALGGAASDGVAGLRAGLDAVSADWMAESFSTVVTTLYLAGGVTAVSVSDIAIIALLAMIENSVSAGVLSALVGGSEGQSGQQE